MSIPIIPVPDSDNTSSGKENDEGLLVELGVDDDSDDETPDDEREPKER